MNADALVLCAGLGTRLRPLTDELPKPLVPVGDRALLEHVSDRLRGAGFTGAWVNSHHLATEMAHRVERIPFSLKVVQEPEIRGTAGGIAGVRAGLLHDTLLVYNGDIYAELPLGQVATTARATGGLCMTVRPRAAGQGTVGLGSDGRIVRLRGRLFGEEVTGGDYLGVCALGPSALSALPDRGCLVQDYALPALARGVAIDSVCVVPEYWFDIGDLDSYLKANLDWLRRAGNAHAGGDVHVAADVEVDRCVIGTAARVTGRGALRRSVLWPGASVEAPLSDAVVTTKGTIARRELANGKELERSR